MHIFCLRFHSRRVPFRILNSDGQYSLCVRPPQVPPIRPEPDDPQNFPPRYEQRNRIPFPARDFFVHEVVLELFAPTPHAGRAEPVSVQPGPEYQGTVYLIIIKLCLPEIIFPVSGSRAEISAIFASTCKPNSGTRVTPGKASVQEKA